MDQSQQQKNFGDVFLRAVAAVAGCTLLLPEVDDDSVDWSLQCKLPCRPKIDVQMKTWTGDNGSGDHLHYPLKRKNYDDLILTDPYTPRMLVLVTVPKNVGTWIALSTRQLAIQHCCYWVSLAGLPASKNDTTVTVYVPRKNVLTAEALQELMKQVNDRGSL